MLQGVHHHQVLQFTALLLDLLKLEMLGELHGKPRGIKQGG